MFSHIKTHHGIALLLASFLLAMTLINDSNQKLSELSSIATQAIQSIPARAQMAAALEGADSGLVGWWKFDEGSGTTAGDASGNGNVGTLTGGPTWIAGKVGSGAVVLDGADDSVYLGQPANLDVSSTNAVTVSVWVNPGNLPKRVIFSRGGTYTGSISEVYYLSINNSYPDKIDAHISDGTTLLKYSSPVNGVTFNEWQHFVMVWNGNTQSLCVYKNGQLLGTCATTSGLNIQASTGNYAKTAIGMDATNSRYYFDGSIDDVRVYNRALSEQEITSLYGTGSETIANSNPITSPGETSSSQNNNEITSTPTQNMSDIYVSPSGSNSNDGSSGRPFQTLNYALQKVSTGGTIHLSAGTYPDTAATNRSGTASQPITIVGAGSNVTIITGSFSILNDYYILSGVKIQGRYLSTEGSHNVIRDNEFTGGTQGVYLTDNSAARNGSAGPSFNLITNNTFYMPIGNGMVVMTGHDNTVSKNMFRNNNGYDALRVWGVNQVISDNIFDRMITGSQANPPHTNHADIIQTFDSSTHYPARGIIFERNYVTDSVSQLGNMEKSANSEMREWTFRNNVFIRSRIQLNNYLPYVKVYNNTAYAVPAANTLGFRFAYSDVNESADYGEVYNNIFIGDGGFYGINSNTVGGKADYNIVANLDGSANAKLTVKEAHGIDGGIVPNDVFMDISRGDFRLKAGSIAIDRGMNLNSTGFSSDYSGASRPQGSAWDIGAYEYVGGGVVTPPIIPPTIPPTPITGDFNNDGIVNSIDLSLMITAWNTSNITYDLNRDGRVNSLDYVVMVRNWSV